MEDKEEPVTPPTHEEMDHAWESLIGRIRIYEHQKKKRRILRYGIAASVILFILVSSLLGYNSFMKPDIYSAQSGEVKIQLADGSLVTLFKGARLTVEKSFPADTRDVYLEGDALFKVAKSKQHPFIVHGINYETKVLGTTFRVIQKGNSFSVNLYEGKVAVSEKGAGNKDYFLSPNQTFSNYGSRAVAAVTPLQKTDQSVSSPHPEAQNRVDENVDLHFRNCNLSDAIAVIEQLYSIRIAYPGEYQNNKISTDLIGSSKEDVLYTLSVYMNLKLIKNDSLYKLEK